eukprot:5730281-Amphidinium_carterae.2
MGKPNGGSQRPSGSGALPAAPKQICAKTSCEELVAVGYYSSDSLDDLRSKSSRARAEKAR